MKNKIIRITTVPESLASLLKGQLKFMSDHFEIVGVSSFGNGRLDEVALKEGIRVVPVEMTRQITPINDLRSAWRLYKLFKKEKPLIVHSHTPKAGTLGMLAAYLARVPYRLHTIAGLPLLEATGLKRRLLDIVEKTTYALATKIYPNSLGLKDIILKYGYTSPRKLKIIGNGSSNGIDTDYFDPDLFTEDEKEGLRQSLDIKKNDFVFVFVGRLVKDKGINELVLAFEKIAEKYKNARLLLVGPFEKDLDPLLPETEEKIIAHEQIDMVGWQNDVRPYFAISDCLVFPSYREGFPNVVLQAGAMGLPSIVTDINGCNEIIKDGANGVLIPPKDADTLFMAMDSYIDIHHNRTKDPNFYRTLIRERFDHHLIWKKLLEEYQQLENNVPPLN